MSFIYIYANDICRVCLSKSDVKIIANTNLQTVFEKLTGNQLITEDKRPESVCNVCYLFLQKCCNFIEVSQKSEEFLTQLFRDGYELTEENLAEMPVIIPNHLPVLTNVGTFVSLPKDNEEVTVMIESEELNFVVLDEREFVVNETENKTAAEIDENNDSTHKFDVKLIPEEEGTNTSMVTTQKGIQCAINSAKDPERKTAKKELKKQAKNDSNKKRKLKKYVVKIPTARIMYKCDRCPKIYTEKAYLNRHIRTHTGEKPYACDVCGGSFTDAVLLKLHFRTHTGEFPHFCHVCSKSFNCGAHLNEHIRTHTGEKPHACRECSCTFAHKSSLKRHIRTHTGEKPYVCDKCSHKFRQISNLQKHNRSCKVKKKN